MKKLTCTLSLLCSLGGSYAGTIGPVSGSPLKWTGLYVGANAGGWWSQNNSVDMDATPRYIKTPFSSDLPNVLANALATFGTNDLSIKSYGFIGGGQVGFNYEWKKFVVGLETDIDGLQHSNNTSTKNVNVLVPTLGTVNIPTNYLGTVSATENINYLGTVRGRLGWLFTPTFLVYGTGGFAYGDVSLNTVVTAQESFSPLFFPPINAQSKVSRTQTGWTIGAGSEWMFKPRWSARIEYIYYNLGTINNNTTLNQQAFIPTLFTGLYAAADVRSSAAISVGTVRVGVSYHFS